jgi:hypothetical protein
MYIYIQILFLFYFQKEIKCIAGLPNWQLYYVYGKRRGGGGEGPPDFRIPKGWQLIREN